MSGGAYNYICFKVDEVAEEIRHQESDPLRKAFADHLHQVAKALRDIEWVDSGDYEEGREAEAILRCITPNDDIRTALEQAIQAARNLNDSITRATEHVTRGTRE